MRTEKYNRKYARISTLHELQTEMDKLDYKLELKEFEIRQDVQGIRNMFSPSYLMGAIAGRMPFSSITGGMRAGFSMITSLFHRKKKRKRRQERRMPCGMED